MKKICIFRLDRSENPTAKIKIADAYAAFRKTNHSISPRAFVAKYCNNIKRISINGERYLVGVQL